MIGEDRRGGFAGRADAVIHPSPRGNHISRQGVHTNTIASVRDQRITQGGGPIRPRDVTTMGSRPTGTSVSRHRVSWRPSLERWHRRRGWSVGDTLRARMLASRNVVTKELHTVRSDGRVGRATSISPAVPGTGHGRDGAISLVSRGRHGRDRHPDHDGQWLPMGRVGTSDTTKARDTTSGDVSRRGLESLSTYHLEKRCSRS